MRAVDELQEEIGELLELGGSTSDRTNVQIDPPEPGLPASNPG